MPSAAQTTVRILIGAVVAVLFVGIKNYRDLGAPGKRPDLDSNEYWGPALKEPYKENKAVRPYDIGASAEVSASVLRRYWLWQLVGKTHSTFCLPKLVCRLVHTLRILIVCVCSFPSPSACPFAAHCRLEDAAGSSAETTGATRGRWLRVRFQCQRIAKLGEILAR